MTAVGLMDEAALVAYIDERYRRRGDIQRRVERLPWYDVPGQNADRELWRAGRFDPAGIQAWAEVLRGERERGLVSERLRIVSADLTDDEAMSLDAALPIISRHEDVRVLREGEDLVPAMVGGDYFILAPGDGPVAVLAMHYTDGGAFLGAAVVPPADHGPYLRQWTLGWALATPYGRWWAEHPELHRRTAA